MFGWRYKLLTWAGPTGLVVVALLLKWVIYLYLGVDSGFLFTLAAIVVAIWSFPLRPILIAIVVKVGLQSAFLLTRSEQGHLLTFGQAIELLLFVGVSSLIAAQADRMKLILRRTETNLRLLNESLEARVRERTREVEIRSEQLRALALDLAETESRERKRLAQLLHDHFQQLVSAAKLKAGVIRRKSTDPAQIEPFKQMEGLLEEAILASRSLAVELSPPILHDRGLCAALQWLARRMEQYHHLTVHLRLDQHCEPDNEQVRMIMFECTRELLFNVVKHSGTYVAHLNMILPQLDLMQISVSDHGCGFDPERIEIMQQPDGSFGLLSIRERLSLIGGQIMIDATPGEGTMIVMTVPLVIKTPEEVPSPVMTSEPGTKALLEGVPMLKVLVADDHKLFREGLISMLRQESYINIVGQTGDGAEAVVLARKLQPDIMIVDVSMPSLNGVQVTSRVSKERPGMRIVGLSMHERDDMAKAMRDAGAAAYCTKSGEMEVLLNILRNMAMQATHPGNGEPIDGQAVQV